MKTKFSKWLAALSLTIVLSITITTNLKSEEISGGGLSQSDRQNEDVSYIPSPMDEAFYQFPTPGTWPGGLAWDGEYFWNMDIDMDVIYKLTETGALVTTFPIPAGGDGSGGLAWYDSCIWAVDEESYRLRKIDPVTGSLIESFALPTANDNSWGLTVQGDFLWYSQYSANSALVKIDPTNASLLFSFTAPNTHILGIAWDGECICGVDKWDPFMYRMDPDDGSVIETIPWEVPQAMGLLYKDGYFWNVSDVGQGAVYKIPSDIVGINLTSVGAPIQIPAFGGSFDYEVALYNYSDSLTICDIWNMALLPSGALFGPLFDPITLILQSGFDANRERTQLVPTAAPAGTYSYIWYVGVYPYTTYDSSSFQFEKLSGRDDSFIVGWCSLSEALNGSITDGNPVGNELIAHYARPNPFNTTTTITFNLPTASHVCIEVYDISGRLISTLVDGWQLEGFHEIHFDAMHLPSSIYIYCLTAGKYRATGKMVLMK